MMKNRVAIIFVFILPFLFLTACSQNASTEYHQPADTAIYPWTMDAPYPYDTVLSHTEKTASSIVEYTLCITLGTNDDETAKYAVLVIKEKGISDEDWSSVIYFIGTIETTVSGTYTQHVGIAEEEQLDYYVKYNAFKFAFKNGYPDYNPSYYDGSAYVDWVISQDDNWKRTDYSMAATRRVGKTIELKAADFFSGPYSVLCGLEKFTVVSRGIRPYLANLYKEYKDDPNWQTYVNWYEPRFGGTIN